MEKILNENKKLKEENEELKLQLKELEFKLRMIQDNPISENNYKLKKENKINNVEEFDKSQNILYDEIKDDFSDEDKESMSIISFLARSDKRVQILKSISQTAKIPSVISKEIGDSSHHVSKYLTNLKEKELVVCLNEEDKRFRFYRITAKGKYYLEIIEKKQF